MHKYKILIVDDEKINLKIAEKILGNEKFDIDFAASGEECLELAEAEKYDVILMDIHMPGINGFQTCSKLHKNHPKLPVIIMTASYGEDSIRDAFDSGAVDYVRKPFKKVELVSRVKRIVKSYQNEIRLSNLYDEIMKDLNLASKMQTYIIPDQLVFTNNLLVSSVYEPSMKVSGDIFDIIFISESEYVFYIGDISGHGVKSALLMTAVRATIRMLIEINKSHIAPHDIVNKLNKSMCDTFFKDNYMTLLFGKTDLKNKTFEYCNAGHPPIIEHKLKTGETIILEDTGELPVGWMKNYEYEESESNNIHFDPDSLLFFYTDGIFECENDEGKDLDIDGLVANIAKFANSDNVATLPHILHDDLLKQGYNLSGDDVTFVTLKYRDDSSGGTFPKYFYYDLDASLSMVAKIASKCEKEVGILLKDEMLAGKVELALVEILNNIVVHGSKKQSIHNMKITVEMVVDDEVLVKIWDSGNKWNPNDDSNHHSIEAIDEKNNEFATSGRGTDIVMEIAEEFSVKNYERINETRLRIAKSEDL